MQNSDIEKIGQLPYGVQLILEDKYKLYSMTDN